MLLRMSEEDPDYEGKWPEGDAMTKPTVESVMRMIHDNEFMRNDAARDQIRAAIESLIAAPAAPVQQAEPVAYLNTKYCSLHHAESRVSVAMDNGELAPLYLHPPAVEAQRLRDALKPFAAIDLTTNQAVDPMDVLRARRALRRE